MKRCAALLVKGNWIIYENITIGDASKLRKQGAVIMHQTIRCTGKEIHKEWITDSGVVIIDRMDNVQ